MPVQDIVQELLDLVAVNSFYISVLEKKLHHAVPLPREVTTPDQDRADQAIGILHRWLAVLDFAIAPITVRDALKGSLPPETAVALLRYCVRKCSPEETDRDKADCVATYLYRESDLSRKPIPQTSDRYHFIMQSVKEFENTLRQTVSDVEVPELTPDTSKLLAEFEFLHQEVDDFRTFDQLMDSGIVQRVRDLKQSFGIHFYHPAVLANVAVYNTMFGKHFDQLFITTTEQIKNFAISVQDEGASIMSKLDDGVIVKNLADVEGEGHHIMKQEYGRAQEHFRKISRFKKVVDKTQKGRAPSASRSGAVGQVAAAPVTPSTAREAAPENKAKSTRSILDALGGGNNIEDGKTRMQLDSMRNFLRGAEKSCLVVSTPAGSIPVSVAEAEILRAEYGSEASFRADFATTVGYLVAVVARLNLEQQEFAKKQASSHLWKPHSDTINYLVQSFPTTLEAAKEILKMAEQRGLVEKGNLLRVTIAKLQNAMQQAQATVKSAKSQSA